MSDIQKVINRMHDGYEDAIIAGVWSSAPIVVINAIIAGAKHEVKDVSFLNGVVKAEEREDVFMGIQMKSVAAAALDVLGAKKYAGDDKQTLGFILNKFEG